MKYEKIMRIRTLLLSSLAMFICIILFFTIEVKASNNITIAGIDMGYSDGSYFSKNGSACTCHGRGTCGEATDCNCIVVSGTCQCYGWSMWVENKLFGYNEKSNSNNFTTVITNYSNCTGSGIYNKLNGKIGVGAHIRTSSSKKGYAHSVSVISYDQNGINITDCNHSGKCQVDVRYCSWDSFASFMNGYGGISFVKTCKDGISQSHDPIGYLDSYSGGEGIVNISGWASDADEPDTGIEIHVYIGGPAGASGVEGHSGIYANLYRSDVGSHGYSASIRTNKTGTQDIYVYAINVGGGNNVLIASGTVTITANEPPKITNVRIENLSSGGYTVRCDVSDNSGIASVKFPTWTLTNGQDDLQWYEGTVSGNSAECTINTSNHNNETNCYYTTHIYVNDTSGNTTGANIGEVYVDSEAPVISNVKIRNVSRSGFDIICQVDDNHSVKVVKFPTWTKKDGQDDIIADWPTNNVCNGEIEGNTVSYHVSTGDHNNETGIYSTHIYAFDECGNSTISTLDIYIGDAGEYRKPVSTATFEGHTYMLFERTDNGGTDRMVWTKVAAFCQSIGGTLACISSEEENNVIASMVSSYGNPCWIGGNDIEDEGTFVWETGEPFIYTNWDSSEPNNYGNQDYIRMYPSGYWDDCESASYAFVCEFSDPILSVSDCSITLSDTSYTYDESEKTPSVIVKYKDNILVKDTDYTISYLDNTEAGLAKVIITGIGSYNGSVTKTFKIAKAKQSIITDALSISIGEKETSKIIATGQGTLNFITNDKDIVDVDSAGIVTGKSAGTAVIKVTADGNNNYLSASIDVTVKVEHIFSVVIKKATCTEAGKKSFICIMCGLIQEGSVEIIPKTDHTWDENYTIDNEATCTEEGWKSIHCSACEAIKENSKETIPATGHQHTELRNAKEASCTEEGYTGDTYCTDCETKLSSGEVIAKKSHTWDEGVVTKAATCTEKGVRTYTCTGCEITKTEDIAVIGHQHTELRNVKAATCAEEGYTGDTFCKDCATKLSSGETIAKKAHSWNEGGITKAATCTKKGVKIYTCTSCETTKTEDISETGHQHTELRNAKEATCTQEGYSGDTYCKDCETKLSLGKAIAKKAHTWDEGAVTKAASCTEKGVKTFSCTSCEITKTEDIPATGHETKIVKFAKKASCKLEGYTGDSFCQKCGSLVEEGEIIPKLDHAWDSGEITKKATCTSSGTRTYKCNNCSAEKTEVVPVTSHQHTELRNVKAATCTLEGYTGDTYCTDCNQLIDPGRAVAKKGHSWDGGRITVQPTITSTGTKVFTCQNCGATRTETIAKLKQQRLTPGKTIKDKSTNGVYKVLKDGLSVEFTKPVSKKTSIRIPDTIKVNGITCKVTGVSANAFKNNTSLKTVTIGKNVTTIDSDAFYGCKKLNKVSGGNGVVKIGDKAFCNCISLGSITIPVTVRSIGKQAFYNCKKLRTIIIKTTMLTSKTIGTKAFTGTYSKPTVRVPAKKLNAYKKLLKSKGMSGKAVYKK